MNQSRYGVLVSLLLLLLLTGGFFFAARVALTAVNNSVQKAIATATVVVLPPTPTPPPGTPTPHGGAKHHAVSGPPATATASNGGQIVISTTANPANAATTFPSTLSHYWCVASLPTTPLSAEIVWRWQHLVGNTAEDVFTSNPYTYATTTRIGYISGPLSAGQYRCEVLVNGQMIGAASFTTR